MLVDLLPKEQVEKLVWKILQSFGIEYLTDEYFGETLTEAYFALQKFDPSRGFKPSTLVYRFCKNRICDLIRENKAFYSRHKLSGAMERYPGKDRTPYFYTAKYEMINNIISSGLSQRTKDVVLTRIDYPCDTLKQVGERLGVSKQAVQQHMLSAEQYFARHNISVSYS